MAKLQLKRAIQEEFERLLCTCNSGSDDEVKSKTRCGLPILMKIWHPWCIEGQRSLKFRQDAKRHYVLNLHGEMASLGHTVKGRYTDFVENPDVLPRLKKRARRCGGHLSSIQESGALVFDDNFSLCSSSSSGNSESPFSITAGETLKSTSPNEEYWIQQTSTDDLPTSPSNHERCEEVGCQATFSTVIASSQEPSRNIIKDITHSINDNHECITKDNTIDEILSEQEDKDDESDFFLFNKPRINRLCRQDIRKCLNLDVMWAMHAKKWLLPNNSAKNQRRPLVFLKKNLRRGIIFFKRYLQQRKVLEKLNKSLTSCCQREPQDATIKKTELHDSNKLNKNKYKKLNIECKGVQKRKEHTPKLHISKKSNKANSQEAPKRSSQGVETKKLSKKYRSKLKPGLEEESLTCKHIHACKQVWMKGDTAQKSILQSSSKQVWIKEDTVARQVAICRPTTKGKISTQDIAKGCEIDLVPGDDPNLASIIYLQKNPSNMTIPAAGNTSLIGAESENVGLNEGIKPLFTGKSIHCGGIWKSIVDEC